MTILEVRNNLKNTIKGKEDLLEQLQDPVLVYSSKLTVADFLRVNIHELRAILVDVERCVNLEASQS